MRKSLIIPSLLALGVAAPAVHAHEAGDIIVRAGSIWVVPNEDSQRLKIDDVSYHATKATVGSDTQLGLNFAYMLTDHFGVELLAATPFTHSVGIRGASGVGAADGKLLNTKLLPPTLSLVYYPLKSSYAFQPYVGFGVNYTMFLDTDLKNSRQANGFSDAKMSNSWGWAAQFGADYMLTDSIMVNAQVRYIDISTQARVHLAGHEVKADVNVDPWVYMVGLGYKF
jgi:outer membrane protein